MIAYLLYVVGVQVELIQEKTKTKHNIWKSSIFRGKTFSQKTVNLQIIKVSGTNLHGDWDLNTFLLSN